MLPIEDIDQNIFERSESEFLDGYKEQNTRRGAEVFIKKKFAINADYSRIPLDVANIMNRELIRARKVFGTCGLVERIVPNDGHFREGDVASYDNPTRTIMLRTDLGVVGTKVLIKKKGVGWLSSTHDGRPYMHEIGRALLNYVENLLTNNANTDKGLYASKAGLELNDKLFKVFSDNFMKKHDGCWELFRYAKKIRARW